MAYDDITYAVTENKSFGSTITVNYPAGSTRFSYDTETETGHAILSNGHNPLYATQGHFTISWGTTSATLTLTDRTVFVAGETVTVRLDRGDPLSDRVDGHDRAIARTFASYTDITADTTLTYDVNAAGTVAAGDRVSLRSGHVYEVAASAASDHHVTTSNGVKLYEAGCLYTTRARLVAAKARGEAWQTGWLVMAGDRLYKAQSAADAFSDMAGLVPVEPYHFDHWGITRETNTGQSTSAIDNATRVQEALDWIGDNGGGTVYAGGGVISFKSTIYWGDRASPVVIQGNGRGVPSSGKASTRQTPGTRFLWGGTAGTRGLIITADRTDTGGTVDEVRMGGSGILDCMIDGGEIGTAATAAGGPMLTLRSMNDPQIRVLIGYAPGGCFEANTLVNGLATGAEDTQRGFIDVETTDVNTSNEPYWHCLFTGQDARNANTSLVPSIRLKLAPESTAIAAHIEFMDGSRFEFLHASTRTAASGDGGKIILHADDTLNTYHGGAYSNQGHARRITFDYVQATEGLVAHATVAGSSSSGPNIIKHYSRGNGGPAPTIEAGAELQYWDENIGLYANYIVPGYTAAQIADITHEINTAYKQGGKIIRDTTNNRIMMARGSAAGGAWDVVDGSASVTPS